MAKPIVAKTYRVRGNAQEGFVIIDFADFSGRNFQFVISPLAVDGLRDGLKSAASAVPAALAVPKKSAGFQSQKRLRGSQEVKEQMADLALENSFVVGLEASKRRVWVKFNLPNNEKYEMLLPIEDARRLSDGINQAIVALSTDPAGATH